MLRKKSYILIGDDRTGKTSFQKHLILYLCGVNKFSKLNTNLTHQIKHKESPRKLKTLFTINRSIQEKMGVYESVENYFNNHFNDMADISILSSHAHGNSIKDIEAMIVELKARYYDVSAVFFSNHLNSNTSEISKLEWQERIVIHNPQNNEKWDEQINVGAKEFGEMIIRTSRMY